MDVIDGTWIKARLTGARGEKKRLAEAMGITPPQLSYVLKNGRNVKPYEIVAILNFFKESIGHTSDTKADLMSIYHRLSPEDQRYIDKTAQILEMIALQALGRDSEEKEDPDALGDQ